MCNQTCVFDAISNFFFWSLLCLLWFLDEFDAYIIVSFVNATLVLSIGETVEEVTDSGFLGTTPTLSCSLLGEDALVQVRKCTSSAHHLWVFSPLCHLVHLSQTGLFSYMVGFVSCDIRTGVLCPVPSELQSSLFIVWTWFNFELLRCTLQVWASHSQICFAFWDVTGYRRRAKVSMGLQPAVKWI